MHLALAYTDYAAANRPRWRALFDHRLPADQDSAGLVHGDLARLFSYIEEPLRPCCPA